MAFWVDWPLWEKLSFILVIIYGCCVLMYSRWRIRKYAAIEARQKEEEAHLYPMLKRDDIPFGARALERGVQVPGIWISSPDTPSHSPQPPRTPTNRSQSPSPEARPPSLVLRPLSPVPRPLSPVPRPLSPAPRPVPTHARLINNSLPARRDDPIPSPVAVPRYARPSFIQSHRDTTGPNMYRYESYGPRGIYPPRTIASAPVTPSSFNCRSEAFGSHEKRASFHNRVLRASQLFDSKRSRSGASEQEEFGLGSPSHEHDSSLQAEQHRASLSKESGLTKAQSKETNSCFEGILRRRSSEEFRRKMSRIFNDRIHMNLPAEELQFDPTLRETKRRKFRASVQSHSQS
ncbi:hypothetical protein N7451_004207 [Penicillium sp. IBT 35674x]|nr:hypothetical protein N7451_004207 [Penicillium sp. IBT 35674x]